MAQTIQSSDLGNDQQTQLSQQNQGTPQQAGQSGATPSAGSSTASSNAVAGSGSGAVGGSSGPKSASGAEAQPAGGYQQQTGQPSQQQSTVQSYNPNTQQGSGYTNIQNVLNANKNNQLGSAVSGGIQGQTNQAQQNLTQSQQQFNQQTAANQANTQGNSQLVQNVLGNTAAYAPGGANQQQGQQFQQLISGQYAGPTQLNNSQQIQNQAANVQQLGQATGSQAGQMGLLQQFVGNPQYTQGQQSLDQLLLGSGAGNNQALANARRGALQLQGQVGGALAGAQATGQQQQAQAQQFGQNVQNQFGQTVAGINSGLTTQAQNLQQGATTAYNQAVSDLQSGNVTPQEAALLGLTQGQQVAGNVLQNANQYLTQNPNAATAQNVASQQNYAQLDALRQLGGTYAPSAAQNVLQQYAGQDQNAQQFQNQANIIGNQSGFNTANQGLISNYQGIVNPAYANSDAANAIMAIYNQNGLGIGGATSGVSNANQTLLNKVNQQLTAAGYGGATGGGLAQNLQWALNNQQSTGSALNNAIAQANAGTGGLDTINITPQQAALQQIAANVGNS